MAKAADGNDDSGRSDEEDRLAARDEIIIDCRAHGESIPDTALRANCSVRTISRRLENPEIARRISARRAERVSEITGSLTDMSETALHTLRWLLTEATQESSRLKAAHMVLTMLMRYRAESDLEDRLAGIERRLDDGEVGEEAE